MNSEHTYPLPEVETQKLDSLREQLPGADSALYAMDRWIRENATAATVAACVLGFLVGRRRKLRSRSGSDPAI